MPYYRRIGDIPPKRHTVHLLGGGVRALEELMGVEGFSHDSSLLYHRHSPSALLGVRAVDEGDSRTLWPNHPVTPLHLRTGAIAAGGDMVTGRTLLLGNSDVMLSAVAAVGDSPLYRNATGDELVYVERGAAVFESVFGSMPVRAGDYVVVPAGTTHRWVVRGEDPLRGLVVEARGHVRPPGRYLAPSGQFLEHAPYCERDLRAPEELLEVDDGPTDVLVRTRAGLTVHEYAHHPFDVVGWDGCLYPWTFSIDDFEPIVGSVHQPPPVHQTFEGPGFVVCSFVPRLYDFHPDAVKVPYQHANVDSDEVLFYAGGDFMSRAGSGVGPGSLTLHPAGFVHGPQPGSWERSVDLHRTDELAVMLDTFRPLDVAAAAAAVADPDYPWSWARLERAQHL